MSKKQASLSAFFGGGAVKSTAPKTEKPVVEKADTGATETNPDNGTPLAAPPSAIKRRRLNPSEETEAPEAPIIPTSATGATQAAAEGMSTDLPSAGAGAAIAARLPADLEGAWVPVADVAAHFKRAPAGTFHPLRDLDWRASLLTPASAVGSAAPLKVEASPIPYAALVRVFTEIEKTTKRLEITALLTGFFRSVILTSPDDLLPLLYLCTNTIAPPYENLELGVGDSLLVKALSEATGRQAKEVKAAADEKGDLGLVAETSRAQQRTLFSSMLAKPAAAAAPAAAGGAGAPDGMGARQVFNLFLSIARESGKSSQDKKVASIKRLLVGSSGVEAKYIVRSMQGKLRIGLAKQTVLVALAHAFALSGPALAGNAAAALAAGAEGEAAAVAADAAPKEEEEVASASEAEESDDDVVVAPAGSRRGKGKAASAAAAPKRKSASAAAGAGASGAASDEASSLTTARTAAGLVGLGPEVLAALPAGVKVEEYTLPTHIRRAVASDIAEVSLQHLVYRRGLAAPAAAGMAKLAAGAGAGTSAAAAAASGIVQLPPAVVDWRVALNLSSERSTARLEAAVAIVKQVYSELPNYDVLVPALLSGGLAGALDACALTPGVPVSPMLAKPTRGVREVLDRFENTAFTCEYKYDGERAQVHMPADGRVSIFSRNSENTTGKYPDIASHLREAMSGALAPAAVVDGAASAPIDAAASSAAAMLVDAGLPQLAPVTSCVMDGEVVAYDRDKGTLLPFQVLSTRSRKDVSVESIKVQVIYAAFDLLLVNGVSLLHVPLRTRRALLRLLFREVPGKFTFATSRDSSDTEEISAFLNDAVKGGCEGLMVKVLDGADSVYEPSKRSLNWLKLKKDYMDGLTDSFDLVPIAAWKGKGKRTGVYGAYLLACYDPEEEVYQAITKVGTGFSDEMLTELTNAMNSKEGCARTTQPKNTLVGDSLLDADVWFDPDSSEVWEVMAADLSISPVHKAALGKVDPAKGIALRFPRFIRRRDDKGTVDATSADQVATMYREQSSTVKGGAADEEDDW